MYKRLRGTDNICRLADGATIPAAPGNADYEAFLRWRDGWTEALEDGEEVEHEPHEPLPEDPLPAPSKEEADVAVAREHAMLKTIRGMTPEQAEAWVEANITGVPPQVKGLLRALTVFACVASRRM